MKIYKEMNKENKYVKIDNSITLLKKKIPYDFHILNIRDKEKNPEMILDYLKSKEISNSNIDKIRENKVLNLKDNRISLSLNSDNDEEIFFDYENVNRLENMQIRDPRIIDENIDKLKITPYEILCKIKRREKEYNIKESNLIVNTFANIDPDKFMNKCIIKSDYLNIICEGLGKTKKLSRLYAAQEFLARIYPDYNWEKLEKIFINL